MVSISRALKDLTYFSPDEAEKIMENLFSSRFIRSSGDPRSEEYKNGFRSGAFTRLLAATYAPSIQRNPHTPGTAQSDAWFAGREEGKSAALGWQKNQY